VKQFRALGEKKGAAGIVWSVWVGKILRWQHASKPHALIKRNNQTKNYENKGEMAEKQGQCLPGKITHTPLGTCAWLANCF